MGIIDPMVIGSVATTGVLEFSTGPTLWLLTAGLLSATAAAIALSGLRIRRVSQLALPKLSHAHLAAVGVSRVK